MSRSGATALVTVALLLLLLPACATGGAFTLYEENDVLSLKGRADRYYTQGLRVSRVFAPEDTPHAIHEIAQELPLYDEEDTTSIGVVLGQNIYTPRDIRIEREQPLDRPYAGWLYAGVVVSRQSMHGADRERDRQETVEIDVGVVGDPSLGRVVQTRWHELIGVRRPRGWEHQLELEPGIVATYERRDRALYIEELPFCAEADVLPGYAASLGNVDTHAAAGVQARLGFNLPRDFGVNTISTTSMEVTSRGLARQPSILLFGAAEGRGVARNIFLDGNTFRDSASVEKRAAVAEARAGIAIQYKALRVTYAWITRSPEFHGQGGWTRYGSLSVGLFLDF